MNSIKTALTRGTSRLEKTSSSARIDAEVLLTEALNKTRTYLYTHPEIELTQAETQHYNQLIKQRELGHPIAHLIGSKEFWSLPLLVSPDTLIPRPETELLVTLTLERLNANKSALVLDLGTGSGAIALALASERPAWQIHAYDKSQAALSIAQKNASQNHLHHIHFGQSDWLDSIPPSMTFDAIVSNPPYIAENDPHLQQGDVRFEPKEALISGRTGLDAITQIIKIGLSYLNPNGFLLIEHGFDQQNAVQALFHQAGYTNIQTWQDWQGNPRVTGGWN